MSSNWYKLVMKATKVKYGKGLLLKGVPVYLLKCNMEEGAVKCSFEALTGLGYEERKRKSED